MLEKKLLVVREPLVKGLVVCKNVLDFPAEVAGFSMKPWDGVSRNHTTNLSLDDYLEMDFIYLYDQVFPSPSRTPAFSFAHTQFRSF